MNASSILDKVGGRKAAACLVALIAVVGIYLAKGSVSEQLTDMIKYIITAYLGANVGADIVAAVQTKVEQPLAAEITLTPTKSDGDSLIDAHVVGTLHKIEALVNAHSQSLDEIKQTLNTVAASVQLGNQALDFMISNKTPIAQPRIT